MEGGQTPVGRKASDGELSITHHMSLVKLTTSKQVVEIILAPLKAETPGKCLDILFGRSWIVFNLC